MSTISRRRPALIPFVTAYADQSGDGDTLDIPEDLSTLNDDELASLATRAGDAFDAIIEAADGAPLNDEDFATAAALTDGIEALAQEQTRRDEAAAQRTADMQALADRRQAALGSDSDEGAGVDSDDEGDDDADGNDGDAGAEGGEGGDDSNAGSDDSLTAGGTARRTSINLSAANRQARRSQGGKRKQAPQDGPSMRDFAFATTGELGVEMGTGLTHADAGRMLGARLKSFPASAYSQAARRGQHMRETHPLMQFRRKIPAEFMVNNDRSVEEAERAVRAATNQARLPQGSLTAAGWCAPSEPMYDICTTASRDGLFNLPEVGISRGGILLPTTPSFSTLAAAVGFTFTEAEAIDGAYAAGPAPTNRANSTAVATDQVRAFNGLILLAIAGGTTAASTPTTVPPVGHQFVDGTVTWEVIPRVDNIEGAKPCYEMPCPTWEDYRLEGDGLCLTADLITQRGYPEGLEWATENALIAHDHHMSRRRLDKVIAGSTYRVMTTGTVGAVAPLLAAIEVRAEAIRYAGVLARNTLLEGVFPYWVRGVIRQDLSVRQGVDLLNVTNAQIDAWFTQRGIVPQYVYDWQALPENAITWPSTIRFLMYEAGAWIAGVDEIITMNTVYDSTQLGQNKYTALFTEEAQLVAPRCGTSEVIEVPICGDGSTAAGVILECDLQPATP